MEVVENDKKRVLWGFVNDHVIEYPTYHEEIGLRGFDFNFLTNIRRGLLEKGPVSFHIY